MAEIRECKRCAEQFRVSTGYINRGRGVFCSLACSAAALNDAQRKNSPLAPCDRFHMLVLTAKTANGRNPMWLVRCDCGVEKTTRASRFFGRRPLLSCGCYRRPRTGNPNAIVRRPLYAIWSNMKSRCRDKTDNLYGGRGIEVCSRWVIGESGHGGFECFVADMGERPSKSHSIDRVNNDGNYEPGNCRWATPKEQARNRSQNIFVEVGGKRLCLLDAIPLINPSIDYPCVLSRLSKGWPIEHAIFEPKAPGKPLRNRGLAGSPKGNSARQGSYTFTHSVPVIARFDDPPAR